MLCGGRRIPLSHTSADFVIAWEAVDLPAGEAEILFTIDGTEYRREIHLDQGMSTSNRQAPVSARDSVAPF